ncbi:hypothetical protein DXX93_04200 [Thalassotalea euphylliae]|uniref:Uncharacterized protein n=1 Tax=Thalassotalea euphylliae TaxID=1655234 RepID=A0A3E0TNJ7_9GAMM|nr:hypothetical protein [Thalassotalea euphylliae]REL25840.1 hypothetical protein DXX93_04200 [Thalassotalea euphylliae]
MLISILFYVVVAVQLWLVSHHYARMAYRGLASLQASDQANTYSENNQASNKHLSNTSLGEQALAKALQRFKLSNQLVLALGVLGLSTILYREWALGIQPPNMFAALLFMAQLLPFGLMELAEKRHYQLVRQHTHQPKRSGSMTKRTLSTFVPVPLQLSALLGIFLAVAFDLNIHAQQVPLWLGFNEQAMQRSLTLIVTNALLFALVLKTIYSPKKDPHQAQLQHLNSVQFTAQSLFYLSIAMSCYFTLKSILVATSAEHLSASATACYAVIVAYASVGYRVRCKGQKDHEL